MAYAFPQQSFSGRGSHTHDVQAGAVSRTLRGKGGPMIEVYTSVPSFAQLSQGQFTIEWRPAGSHFVSQRVALDVALKSGLAQQDKIQAPYSGSANLTLRVDNGQAHTKCLVDGVEHDSDLYLFGLARKFFLGLLRHPAH